MKIEEVRRILLVRLREIGDVVFTTPAVGALRQRFPQAHISYVVEPAAAPVVTSNPHINEVIVARSARGLSRLRAEAALVRRLRSGRYDLAIDFHGGPRASLLTWLSGAPARVGYDIVGRSWMYTQSVRRPRELRRRHSVLNQWDLLAPFDIAAPAPAASPVEMPIDPAAQASVDDRLARAGVRPADRVIVVHVSAGNPFRRWPVASFAKVAADLAASDRRHQLVMTSGPSDRDAREKAMADARARLAPSDSERVLACGEFSLAELRALVDRSALFIGGDSGPLHVAATSHVPIVALYGPTLPARSTPWRAPVWPTESVETAGLACRPCDQRSCQPGDFRCLGWIQPQQVVDAAHRALDRAHAADPNTKDTKDTKDQAGLTA